MGFHVADHSDDLAPLWRSATHLQANLFSEWLPVLQIATDKLLVYNGDAGRGGVIRLRECPATQQRDTRRLEVIWADDGIESAKPLVRQFGLAFDSESNAARSSCRQVGSNCDGLGTRNLPKAGEQIAHEECLVGSVVVSRVIEGHAGGKKMVCSKA